MPYKIKKFSPHCWGVINKRTGRIHSRCTTEAKARSQIRLLNAVDHGWVPSNRKTRRLTKPTGRVPPWHLNYENPLLNIRTTSSDF